MKLKQIFFIAAFFISTLSFAQTKVSQDDLKEVVILSNQGQADKALSKINSLRKTVTTKDSLYIVLIMLSTEISTKTFDCESAIRDNEEIIKLVPIAEIGCQTQIAQFKKYLGDFDGAVKAYKRILELDPTNDITINNMSSALISSGKFQEAINILNSNFNAERNSFEYFHYAVAYFNMNKLDSAKLSIDKYLKTDNATADFEAYKIAAKIYSSLGDKNNSCDYITKANEIIDTIKTEEKISKQSKKVQDYYFVRETLKQIDETRKLKTQLCKI